MAMAWLAHAKGLKKGQGKDSGKGLTMPSGASGKGTALAIEDAENQELASKLAKGKKLREGPAEDEKDTGVELSRRKKNKEAVEPEPKTKKNDKNGEDEPKKKQKKNQNAEKGDESKKKKNEKEGEYACTDERKKKKEKKGEDADADRKKTKEKTNTEGDEMPKKKKKRSEEEVSDVPTLEPEKEGEDPSDSSTTKGKGKKEKVARLPTVPSTGFDGCDDEGEEEEAAPLKRKRSKVTWTEHPKKMQATVGEHPLVRLRTKTSEESLDNHVTPDRPTTKPASPGSGTSTSSHQFSAQKKRIH